MSDRAPGEPSITEVRRDALRAIGRLRARIEELEAGPNEPLAIVSAACRLPGGVRNLDDLWALLEGGADPIAEVPADRWDADRYHDPDPDRPGTSTSRWGGFLDDVRGFDASFFDISPREAPSIDPQQRLLLETAWEAIEGAGLTRADLAGSSTGVFVGLCGTEAQLEALADLEAIDAYSYLGTAASAIVARLNYWLDLRGPSLPVDTSCSSSLVALHLAAGSLRRRECDLALVGGVNVLLGPRGHVVLGRLRALSPTGRCRTFSADADGYVRSEGCGVVLVKRLADARSAGDRVLARLLGTAINHDGRTYGFTAPSARAQQDVLRRALDAAAVGPASVAAVECHGTGTPLGDPIEVGALAAVYGVDRPAGTPLVLGSAKAHLGHAEGAAGIASVLKAIATLRHRRFPAVPHLDRLNPAIRWDEVPLLAPVRTTPWPAGEAPRRIGVSSFGFSGTNAHAILEEEPDEPESETPAVDDRSIPLLLSARTEGALRAGAARLAGFLRARPATRPIDVSHSLATRRTHFEFRAAAVLAGDLDSILSALDSLAAGGGDGWSTGRAGAVDRPAGLDGDGLESLVELHVRGHAIDWRAHLEGRGGRAIDLPTYAFERGVEAGSDRLAPPDARPLWAAIEGRDAAAFRSLLGLAGGDRPDLEGVLDALCAWRTGAPAPGPDRYALRWRESLGRRPVDPSGRWVLVATDDPAGREIGRRIEAAFDRARATLIRVEAISTDDRRALAARLGRGPVRGVLSALALDEAPHPRHPAVPVGLALNLALIQALDDLSLDAPLWFLTRGAVSTGEGDPLGHPLQAMSWGLARCASLELAPGRWGGAIDLPSAADDDDLAGLVPAVASRRWEDQIALRGGRELVGRLVRSVAGEGEAGPWRPGPTVLITGGTGALGGHVARWVLEGGARRVVLVSRRGRQAAGADERIGPGDRVEIVAADVADAGAVRDLLATVGPDSVVHAAGVDRRGPLVETDLEDLAAALSGKALGARHLHEMAGEFGVRDLVLFGSMAGACGGGGQGAYAAANAYLDALAGHRRGLGLPGVSIAWGSWGGPGMASRSRRDLESRGQLPMSPPAALAALGSVLAGREPTPIVARLDWARFAPAFASGRPRPLLEEIAEARDALRSRPVAGDAGDAFRAGLEGLSAEERGQRVEGLVLEACADALGLRDGRTLDRLTPLTELGMDSLMLLALRERLEGRTGRAVPTGAILDHPTPAALARYLLAESGDDRSRDG